MRDRNEGGSQSNPLEDNLEQAITAMRSARPPADMTARVEAALAARLGPSGSSGPDGPNGLPKAATSTSTVGATQTIIGGIVAVAIGTGVWMMWPDNPQGVPTAAPSLAVSAPLPESRDSGLDVMEDDAGEGVESAAASASSTAPPPTKRSAPPTEGQLLSRAKRALPQNPNVAVQLLQQHARLYPDGMLAQEREVLLIEARAQLGKHEEAQRSAREFLQDHPDTAYGNKIRESAFGDASKNDNSSR